MPAHARRFRIVDSALLCLVLSFTLGAESQRANPDLTAHVGRIELVTPPTMQAVKKILATHDIAELQKYDRFLEPIVDQMKAENPAQAQQIDTDLDLTYRSPPGQPQMVQRQTVQPQTPK